MVETSSDRFTFLEQHLNAQIGAEAVGRLLRRVGRFPGTRVPATVAQEAELIRQACVETGDAVLGARLGAAYREAQTLAAYVARSSETLRDAVEGAIAFHRLSDETTELALVADDGQEFMHVSSADTALRLNLRYQEFLTLAVLTRMRAVAGRVLRPEAVVFGHQVADRQQDFERIAGCPVRFGEGRTGILFAPGALDVRLGTHDPVLAGHLRQLAMAQLSARKATAPGLRAEVEKRLLDGLPQKFLTADELAQALGMSRRTLSRKLAEEGTGYRQVAAALRFDLAKAQLRDGMPVSEVSFMLGYADQATFSAAFRGWAGMSPRAYRGSQG